MALFDKVTITTWEKTRPSEAKGSGIADAIKNWEKKCPASRTITSVTVLPLARAGAQAFLDAIATADRKLKAIKKPDTKKQKAIAETEKLLVAWERGVKSYQAELGEAEERVGQGMVHEAVTAFYVDLMEQNFESLGKNLSDMQAGARAGTAKALNEAIKASARATFTIKNMSKLLNKDGFKQQVANAVSKLKVQIDAGKAQPPERWREWKTQLEGTEQAIEALREKIDALMEELDKGADHETENQDPGYVKDFKKLVKQYQDTLKEMQACEGKARTEYAKATKLVGFAKVTGTDDHAIGNVTKAATEIAEATREIEAELEGLARRYRDTTNGAIAKARKALNPHQSDVDKVLAPLTDRLNDANLRGTRGVGVIRGALVKALSTMDKTTGRHDGREAAQGANLLKTG